MENENRNTALVPMGERALAPTAQKPAGYWAKMGGLYRAATFVIVFLLALFLVTFSVLFAHAFTYDSIFYFGKDIAALTTLPDGGEATVYYDYKGENAVPVSYRGGVAVAHTSGVDIYAANSERRLSVAFETPYLAPRLAVSRNYLVAYDFGSTAFCVCNSYDQLYEGNTAAPIYGVYLSDSGYFTVITGSDTALSEVLLYDSDFNLRQRFSRASATVAAPISENGRTVTLVGATAIGTVVDVYVVGDEKPLSSAAFDGFPLAAGYTSGTKLSVLTDISAVALSTEGKVLGTVSYEGAALAAYSIGEEGVALALEVNRTLGGTRVLTLNKRGNVTADVALAGLARSVTLSGDSAFLLFDGALVAVNTDHPEEIQTLAVPRDARAVVSVTDGGVRVLSLAQALYFKVGR